MVDLCLRQTFRSLGSTVELLRSWLICVGCHCFHVSWFIITMTVSSLHLCLLQALEQSCPRYYLSPSHILPFTCQTYWLNLVVLNVLLECWFLFYFSLHICYTVCPFPPYNCVSDWPAYHLYLEIYYLSELGESLSCGVFSQPAFGEILLLPLVVVTGIFLKNKSCLHFSYQECL